MTDETAIPNSWSPKLKRIAKIGSIVIGVILLLGVIITLSINRDGGREVHHQECILHITAVTPNLTRPSAVWTKPDASNMAKLASYIHIYELGYIALDFIQMRLDKSSGQVIFEDACVSVSFGHVSDQVANATTEYIYGVKWTFIGDSIDESFKSEYGDCDAIEPAFEHKFDNNYRYTWPNEVSYRCLKKSKEDIKRAYPVAELVVKSFELEFDGKPEMISCGLFSKAPYSIWSS